MEQSGAVDHEVKRERRKRTPEEVVSRFQARIVKAQQEGRWNKVKVLQGLLTHSQSAKIVATERVTTNKGKGTPGVDKET
jgi:RNA-directed DNA polymerase